MRRLLLAAPALGLLLAATVVASTSAAFSGSTASTANLMSTDTLLPPTDFRLTEQCTASAPVTFVAAVARNGQGTSLALGVPPGVQPGHLLLAHLTTRYAEALTAPPGWTLARIDGTGPVSAVYWRVATSAEPSTYTWTSGGVVRWAGAMGSWAGTDTSAPVGATSGATGSGPSIVAPQVTTDRPNLTLVAFFTQTHSGGSTPPSGMAERWDVVSTESGSASQQVGGAAADELVAAAGPTGSRTATGQSAPNVGQLVALNRKPDTFQILAQWTPTSSTYATGYRLTRTGGAAFPVDVTPASASELLDTDVSGGSAYTYGIVAVADTWTSVSASASLTTRTACS